MPFKPTETVFTDSSHEDILYYHEAVAEPISPATTTNGATVQLYDSPQSLTETYRALRCAGPAAARIDLKIGGGAFADASGGIAVGGAVGVEQSVQMRIVALPFASAGTDPQVWFSVVATDTGEADWTG